VDDVAVAGDVSQRWEVIMHQIAQRREHPQGLSQMGDFFLKLIALAK
jgi:hypothetical protein